MGWNSTPTQDAGTQLGSSASGAKAFAATVGVGNMIVVHIVTWRSGGHTAHAISDDKGNSSAGGQYVQIGSNLQVGANMDQSDWYFQNVTNAPKTITVTPSAAAFLSFGISEWSAGGVPTTGSLLDGANSGTGTAMTTADSGAVSVIQPNELLVGQISNLGAGNLAITPTGTAGYQAVATSGDQNLSTNYQIVSSATHVTGTWAGGQQWGATGASFKSPAIANAPYTWLLLMGSQGQGF